MAMLSMRYTFSEDELMGVLSVSQILIDGLKVFFFRIP